MKCLALAVALAIALASAGCKNTTDPTLTREVCDDWDLIPMTQMQTSCIDTSCTTTPVVTTIPVCGKSHTVRYRNPDYEGPR